MTLKIDTHAGNKNGAGRKKARNRILCALAALVMAVTVCGNTALTVLGASTDGFIQNLSENFEAASVTKEYGSTVDKLGANYIHPSGIMKVEGSSGSITGQRSLRVQACDIRWWGLNIEEKQFRVGFSVKVGSTFDNEFTLYITAQKGSAESELMDGTSLVIRNTTSGDTYLYGADKTQLCELKKDTVYKIYFQIDRGSDTASVTVNGETLDTKFKLAGRVYGITGMSLYVPVKTVEVETAEAAETGEASGEAVSEATPEPTAEKEYADSDSLLLDDVFISTKGREYPQPYSMQEPGEVPRVEVPEAPDDSEVKVYVDTQRIEMSKTYVTDSTVYISAEQFFKGISIDYEYDKNERKLTINTSKVQVSVEVPGSTVTVNGKEVELLYPVRTIDNVIMISPNFINEVFNAKVWWDADSRLLAVTSGSRKSDGILRVVGDKLFMNGEPYYEISFNKYDLFQQLWAASVYNGGYPTEEYQSVAAEAALAQLHECGFKSIRVFCGANVPELMYDAVVMGKYFETMDQMFDLCDKYDIKVVVCMELISDNFVAKDNVPGYGLVNRDESVLDLVAYPDSESRQLVKNYITTFVNRYKSRSTVLMYEVVNEGNLSVDVGWTLGAVKNSLQQLADFYTFCRKTIHGIDPDRIVSGGDAILRLAQWNLYEAVMNGQLENDWTTDTDQERLYALAMLNSGLDVISTHTYSLGSSKSEGKVNIDGEEIFYDFNFLMAEAHRLGKPLYNGESNVAVYADYDDYFKDMQEYLSAIVDAGVQLTHWWTFRSDRVGFDDGEAWRNDSGEFLQAIIDANALLKETWMVNGVAAENSNVIWEDSKEEIYDPSKITTGADASRETSHKEAFKWFAIIGAIMVAAAVVFVLLFRFNTKHRQF